MVIALLGINGCLNEPQKTLPFCAQRPDEIAAADSTPIGADWKISPASAASSSSRQSNFSGDESTAAPHDTRSTSSVIFKAFREADGGIAFKYAVYISAIRSKTSFDGN